MKPIGDNEIRSRVVDYAAPHHTREATIIGEVHDVIHIAQYNRDGLPSARFYAPNATDWLAGFDDVPPHGAWHAGLRRIAGTGIIRPVPGRIAQHGAGHAR